MKRIKGVILLLALMVFCSIYASAKEFKAWARARGSYQFVLRTDFKDDSAYEATRARVGFDGSFIKDLYFKVDIDAKNTKKGSGAELKAAFLSWHFAKYHWFEAGAITTTFTRALSGTEFAFMNYDITTSLDAYQYGIQLKGLLLDGFLSYYLCMTDGEGFKKINTGNGFLYSARVELQLMEKNKKINKDGSVTYKFADLREGAVNKNDQTLTLGLAVALDNKYESPDFGITLETYNGMHYVADVTFRQNGFCFFAQGNYNTYGVKYDGAYWGGENANVKESYGGFAQISYNLGKFLPVDLEPMIKYEYWKDTVNEGADDRFYVKKHLAIGVNLYLKNHRFKINAEYRRVLNNDYIDEMIIKPAENFFGIRVTHSFSSSKITLK